MKDSLEQQNKELRISKNILIDRVEEQEKELLRREEELRHREEELSQLKGKLKSQEQEQRKIERKERRKRIKDMADGFFNRIEGILYRIWLGAWMLIIGVIVSLTATVLLNEQLRNSIFTFFSGITGYLPGH